MIIHRKHLLTGAVLASVGLLLAGCSGSSNTPSEALRNDSTAVSGITVNLEDTPGEWVEAMEITEENKKKVNDFQVTTVSGECYFASETILGETVRGEKSGKYRETSSVPYPSDAETKPKTGGGEVKFEDGTVLSEMMNKVYTPTEVPEGEKPLSYEVQSNEGELTFKGVTKKNSVSLVTTVSNGGTIQLTYGCNPGMLKDKEQLKANLKEMVDLVDIEIERDDK